MPSMLGQSIEAELLSCYQFPAFVVNAPYPMQSVISSGPASRLGPLVISKPGRPPPARQSAQGENRRA